MHRNETGGPTMKKWITSGLVISAMVLSPALRAEEAAAPAPGVVGQASDDGVNAAKSKKWQNIALAVGAVAVAITALILVANNDGHK